MDKLIITIEQEPNVIIDKREYKNPCEGCPNNPQNNPFASGYCNCVLPYIANPVIC